MASRVKSWLISEFTDASPNSLSLHSELILLLQHLVEPVGCLLKVGVLVERFWVWSPLTWRKQAAMTEQATKDQGRTFIHMIMRCGINSWEIDQEY